MKFADVIRTILRAHPDGLTPQQLRDKIKAEYPDYYGTESHLRNVDKGHYKDIDHALLAQIYIVPRQASDIFTDRSTKPMTLALGASPADSDPDVYDAPDPIETENLERLEAGAGTVYVLGTNLYTRDGEEIVKVGITTGDVQDRIRQLYTTGVPTKFHVIQTYDVHNYLDLEQSLHRLLDPYRINRAREFFTEQCVPFVDRIASLHMEIQANQGRESNGDAQQGAPADGLSSASLRSGRG